MFIQGIELWFEKWFNKKTIIPIGLLFLILVMLTVIWGGRTIEQWKSRKVATSTTSSVESWKITNTVCAPIIEVNGNLEDDMSSCFQSTLSIAAINAGGRNGWLDLPDGHEYKPLFAYKCFSYGDVSFLRHGLEPNLFDYMFKDELPKNGCKWSCDPTTEAECRE